MLIRLRDRRTFVVAVLLVCMMILATAGVLASFSGNATILLPQGNNRVPSCEDAADIVAFDLSCPSELGSGDTVGDEPLIPVDLPPPSLAIDELPSVVP